MKFIIPLILAVFVTLPISGCSSHEHMDHGTHDEIDGLTIKDVVVRPPLPGRDIATGYFTLVNNGEATTLVSASSPVSDRVEIHTHTNENGVMKMRRVEGVSVSKGESVEFKPGSYHLMMFNVNTEDDLWKIPLSLTFENGHVVTVDALVNSAKSGGHSGHGNH